MKIRIFKISCLILALLLSMGCSGPEAKKMKFYGKGKTLYEKGDMVKAALELKNAIQIDPKFADAYYMLGMVEMKLGNLKNSYGYLTKATELAPGNMKAQIQLGKLFLAGGAPDKAMEKAELVLKREPKNEDAMLLKATVLLSKKEGEKARELLEGMIAQGLRKPDVY
ncbi:MAG: tetratricopeptide repeat protein, partial [Geobacteraceae bacterium]|nr:tetratricopeptide repeat protein [Geobacteraceae bacterium]